MENSTLGKRIRAAHKKAALTQDKLSEKLNISVVYMSELERGIKLPSLTLFVKIAEVLNVSTDELLRDELDSGKSYVYNDITLKLDNLTPKQRAAAAEILEVFIRKLQS